MGRPRILNDEQVQKLRFLVLEKSATPSEVAAVLKVSRNTAYTYIRENNLPIRRPGDHLKFYDPSWKLPTAPTPSGFKTATWGPWVHTGEVPRHEAHPRVWKQTTSLPLSLMMLAQHVTRKVLDLSIPCLRFKDGNCLNVTLENLEIIEGATNETDTMSRVALLAKEAEEYTPSQEVSA